MGARGHGRRRAEWKKKRSGFSLDGSRGVGNRTQRGESTSRDARSYPQWRRTGTKDGRNGRLGLGGRTGAERPGSEERDRQAASSSQSQCAIYRQHLDGRTRCRARVETKRPSTEPKRCAMAVAVLFTGRSAAGQQQNPILS
jgi:hypothetical protein